MELSDLTKRMILISCLSALVFIVSGTVYHRSFAALPFALGTVIGTLLTAFKLFMLKRTVEKTVNMDEKNAGNYLRLQYLFRFLLTAVILLLGAITPFISLWGVVAGVFTLHISTLSVKFFINKG